ALGPEAAWDAYVSEGSFGNNGGSVFVGSDTMATHVIVGSRFGDTNVAGMDVRVKGSDTNSIGRFAQIGFHDAGAAFAPRGSRGGDYRLDMKIGPASGDGAWLLSDGRNNAGGGASVDQAPNGWGDPIVGVVGKHEVDVNGDGIMDGVRGINSSGVVEESFIPYANHYNSSGSGSWWWQQIEDAGSLE